MKNLSKLFLFAFLVSTFCVAANAQYTAAQRAKDVAEVAKMDDLGFDAAFVVKPASIRETPEVKGKLLLSVKRADILSLAVRDAKKNWYNVVDQKSGVEGWIEGGSVVIKLTTNTATGPPLEEEEAAAEADPEVSITNMEEKTALRIRINGTLYVIQPQTTKVLTLKPGNFSYYGWSPGIRPATGKSVLLKGKKYSWRFKIYNRRS